MNNYENIRKLYTDINLLNLATKFNKFVLFGLKESNHSHRFIYEAYKQAFEYLDIDYIWISDQDDVSSITKNDLVYIHGTNTNLDKVLDQNPFIIDMHIFNMSIEEKVIDKNLYHRILDYDKKLTDIEHSYRSKSGYKLDILTYYDPKNRILAQPWGTDVHPNNFYSAANVYGLSDVIWVGSVWKSKWWGNWDEIHQFKNVCHKKGLKFMIFNQALGIQNAILTRQSRFSPTIAGVGQARKNYLACRFFKNISYGQLCMSNVSISTQLLQGNVIIMNDWEQAVDEVLMIPKKEFIERVAHQQDLIKDYTIFQHIFISLFLLIEENHI